MELQIDEFFKVVPIVPGKEDVVRRLIEASYDTNILLPLDIVNEYAYRIKYMTRDEVAKFIDEYNLPFAPENLMGFNDEDLKSILTNGGFIFAPYVKSWTHNEAEVKDNTKIFDILDVGRSIYSFLQSDDAATLNKVRRSLANLTTRKKHLDVYDEDKYPEMAEVVTIHNYYVPEIKGIKSLTISNKLIDENFMLSIYNLIRNNPRIEELAIKLTDDIDTNVSIVKLIESLRKLRKLKYKGPFINVPSVRELEVIYCPVPYSESLVKFEAYISFSRVDEVYDIIKINPNLESITINYHIYEEPLILDFPLPKLTVLNGNVNIVNLDYYPNLTEIDIPNLNNCSDEALQQVITLTAHNQVDLDRTRGLNLNKLIVKGINNPVVPIELPIQILEFNNTSGIMDAICPRLKVLNITQVEYHIILPGNDTIESINIDSYGKITICGSYPETTYLNLKVREADSSLDAYTLFPKLEVVESIGYSTGTFIESLINQGYI